MLRLGPHLAIPSNEVEVQAIRAQGAGGQNVNKVSTAIHLRFDIKASSLPDFYKEKLLAISDQRISKDGVIVIKSQQYRSQEKNKEEAYARLTALIKSAVQPRKKRRATRPTKGSQKRRVDRKTKHGRVKSLRAKVDF